MGAEVLPFHEIVTFLLAAVNLAHITPQFYILLTLVVTRVTRATHILDSQFLFFSSQTSLSVAILFHNKFYYQRVLKHVTNMGTKTIH